MRHRCAFFKKKKSHRVWLCQQYGVFTPCRIEDSGPQPYLCDVICDLLKLLLLLNTIDFVKVFYDNITTSQHVFQLNCQWLVKFVRVWSCTIRGVSTIYPLLLPCLLFFFFLNNFYYFNEGVWLIVNHFNHLSIPFYYFIHVVIAFSLLLMLVCYFNHYFQLFQPLNQYIFLLFQQLHCCFS